MRVYCLALTNAMIGALGHDSALVRLYWTGTTWANQMSFVMNYVPGAISIAQPVDQQYSALSLYQGCPLGER